MPTGPSILVKLYEQRDSEDGQTDFEIRCFTDVHRVHKIIISAASSYFNKACNGPFKETEDGAISLHEDYPEAVSAMIQFMYTSDYTQGLLHEEDCDEDAWETPKLCHCRLYLHAQAYGLGVKYGLNELNVFAGQVFKRALNLPYLSYGTLRSAVAVVYDVTPEGDPLRKHTIKVMVERGFGWSTKDLEQVMVVIPGSAKDIAIQLFEATKERDKEIVLRNEKLKKQKLIIEHLIPRRKRKLGE